MGLCQIYKSRVKLLRLIQVGSINRSIFHSVSVEIESEIIMNKAKYLLFCASLFVFFVGGCDRKADTTNASVYDLSQYQITGESAYRLFAGLRSDQSIRGHEVDILQVCGYMHQDYFVYLIFEAGEEAIDSLIESGYKTVSWDSIESEMIDVEEDYRNAMSQWDLERVTRKECFAKSVTREHSADYMYVVIDKESRVVYAYSYGEVF